MCIRDSPYRKADDRADEHACEREGKISHDAAVEALSLIHISIVTMTAGLYGPAFIPAVTKQLRCDALTAPGLICGALGYAVGTFLGAALFWICLLYTSRCV